MVCEHTRAQSDRYYNMQNAVAFKNLAVAMAGLNVFLCWFKLVSFRWLSAKEI